MSPARAISAYLLLGTFVFSQLALGAPKKQSQPVDFNAQIRPIISAKCYHCHGPDEGSREADLRLDLRDEAVKDRKGTFVIKPGNPKQSELIARIHATDPDDIMPPTKTGHPLTAEEKDLLKQWIQEGAPYAEHWSFKKPSRPTLPKVKQKSLVKSPVDHFILAKLEANGLKASPMADRHALIRRLSLDLTGLPPTPAEVDAFVKDKSPKAYEALVDRLLASPAFGEKWARVWLDLARYADSAGYGSDPLRLNIWPYRDWLIRALNNNMPYDQFTIEQIAGDLLENPTEDQRVATAFHRNTMTNTEGGTDDEEWRVAAVKDRVNVTVQAWMGLTLGCAQCHTHKFDPITHTEYYQFYAFFNQTADNDQPDERPTLPLPNADERKKLAELNGKLAVLEKQLSSGSSELDAELTAWEAIHNSTNIWTALQPGSVTSSNETTFRTLDDHSILATNAPNKGDTYTVAAAIPNDVTAIRLEALPHDELPAGGPGHSAYGNFVLNELRVVFKPTAEQKTKARFIRVELPGKEKILSLAEVQIFSGTNNIAARGTPTQSSLSYNGDPKRAIDGNTDGVFDNNSTTHTDSQTDPWWEIDLGEAKSIDAIVIWNRKEVPERLVNFKISALDEKRQAVWNEKVATAPQPSVKLTLNGPRAVKLKNPTASINQKSREVEKAIDNNTDKASGWGIPRGATNEQHAVFEFADKLPAGELEFTLVQTAGQKQSLGRFRLLVTGASSPVLGRSEEIQTILNKPRASRTDMQRKELAKWFQPYAQSTGKIRQEMDRTKSAIDKIKPQTVPVMVELAPEQQRVTRLLNKGNFLDPADPVTPGVLNSFHPWPSSAPTNRLGVARWLVDKENPLTARVAVNRLWSQLFGSGIVETEEDFGTQGTLPSHPELLDWLAVEFMQPTPSLKKVAESNIDQPTPWNLKRMIKLLVMSGTYQQTSRVTPELLRKDPRNRLLSRSPRSRLDAELVRDQALALSGLLSPKIGGPSVYPPQPDGLWRAAFNGQRSYNTSTGEDKYRRGLYTIWRRTVPYPSMATFDAPSRESCTFRRLPTNTPLQAYVTMNDPVYVEASQSLGRRLVREGGATPEERIRFGLRLVLARPERTEDVQALLKLYQSELSHYQSHEKEATKLATNPIGELPKDLLPAEAAAWTVIGNVLLNLDGLLTKS